MINLFMNILMFTPFAGVIEYYDLNNKHDLYEFSFIAVVGAILSIVGLILSVFAIVGLIKGSASILLVVSSVLLLYSFTLSTAMIKLMLQKRG